MVLYFDCKEKAKEAGYTIYMGADKYENEQLIKWGWPEDVWFHVDDMSSAHVYLRMPPGKTIADIPKPVLHTCCQLVKDNSIEGTKKAKCKICYTPWANLRKSERMDVGTIGFHDEKMRLLITVEKDKEEIKRVSKTKKEAFPDLEAQRGERDALERQAKKAEARKRAAEEKKQKEDLKAEAEERSYDRLFDCDKMTSNDMFDASEDASAACDFEDDFM